MTCYRRNTQNKGLITGMTGNHAQIQKWKSRNLIARLRWRYSHERNRNNKFRHARIRQRRVVSADHGKRSDPRGCDSEGERNTEGANEMKILTDEAEDKLVSIIGTLIVVAVVVLIIGIVGGIESGRMW